MPHLEHRWGTWTQRQVRGANCFSKGFISTSIDWRVECRGSVASSAHWGGLYPWLAFTNKIFMYAATSLRYMFCLTHHLSYFFFRFSHLKLFYELVWERFFFLFYSPLRHFFFRHFFFVIFIYNYNITGKKHARRNTIESYKTLKEKVFVCILLV